MVICSSVRHRSYRLRQRLQRPHFMLTRVGLLGLRRRWGHLVFEIVFTYDTHSLMRTTRRWRGLQWTNDKVVLWWSKGHMYTCVRPLNYWRVSFAWREKKFALATAGRQTFPFEFLRALAVFVGVNSVFAWLESIGQKINLTKEKHINVAKTITRHTWKLSETTVVLIISLPRDPK